MQEYRPKTLPLKDMPEDVYKALLQLQGEAKAKCNCQKSLPTIVYSLIRQAAKQEVCIDMGLGRVIGVGVLKRSDNE